MRPQSTIPDDFADLFPVTSNADLAVQFGKSVATIVRWGRCLRLKKNAALVAARISERLKGHTHSPETRRKIAAAHQGKVISDETIARIKASKIAKDSYLRGARHYKWKGGRPWERFKRPEYVTWRDAVLGRDGYICQQCDRECAKREKGLAAHHIKPYAKYPEGRYDVSNGTTLCRTCHMELHGRKPRPKELVTCACGCGELIDSVDRYGNPRRFVNGHSARGRKMSNQTKQLLSSQRKGRSLTPEHRAKIKSSLQHLWGWSRDHACCAVCGTTDRPHAGHGLCSCCYQRRAR